MGLIPVFAFYAVRYGRSVEAGEPEEWLRWTAVGVYVLASVSDGIDGWVARRFDQRSKLGATLDPLADKALLLTGLFAATFIEWGAGWHLPIWFIVLVIVRDIEIIGGVIILQRINGEVPIRPHWTGKVCTVTQMVAMGWIMLGVTPISPIYPAMVAAFFTFWSGLNYFLIGYRQLPGKGKWSR